MTGRVQLQFRSEFFNPFNRTNMVGQIITTVNTTPVAIGTPRQIQFALRLEFELFS